MVTIVLSFMSFFGDTTYHNIYFQAKWANFHINTHDYDAVQLVGLHGGEVYTQSFILCSRVYHHSMQHGEHLSHNVENHGNCNGILNICELFLF